jgi:hypothetical protein
VTQSETVPSAEDPCTPDKAERIPDRDLVIRVNPASLRMVEVPSGFSCVILVRPDQPVGIISVVTEEDVG